MLCSVCIIIYVYISYMYTYVHLLMYQPVSGRFKYIATKLPTLDANSAFFPTGIYQRSYVTIKCWRLKLTSTLFWCENNVNAVPAEEGSTGGQSECIWAQWKHDGLFKRYVFAGCRSIQIPWLDSHSALKKHLGTAQNVAPKDSLLPFQRTHSWRIWLVTPLNYIFVHAGYKST